MSLISVLSLRLVPFGGVVAASFLLVGVVGVNFLAFAEVHLRRLDPGLELGSSGFTGLLTSAGN